MFLPSQHPCSPYLHKHLHSSDFRYFSIRHRVFSSDISSTKSAHLSRLHSKQSGSWYFCIVILWGKSYNHGHITLMLSATQRTERSTHRPFKRYWLCLIRDKWLLKFSYQLSHPMSRLLCPIACLERPMVRSTFVQRYLGGLKNKGTVSSMLKKRWIKK